MRRVYLRPLKPESDGSFLIDEGDEIVQIEWHYPDFDFSPNARIVWGIDASVSDD